MTGRDRIVVMVIGVVVVLAAFWLLVVSPERNKADKLGAQVSTAHGELSSAQAQLASARAAQAQYPSAYASVVSLGKAVPPQQEVPSLIYQLEQTSSSKHVDFASISVGTEGSASSAKAASAQVPAAAAAGFTQLPFTFIFNGSFFDLEHVFTQLNGFAMRNAANALQVRGRLLTVQSVKLAQVPQTSEGHKTGATELTGTITATAYVLPAGQGLTGPSPAGGGAATPASGSGSSSSPTAPAIARVTP
jgi:Tfp pilus assembly protein PilO